MGKFNQVINIRHLEKLTLVHCSSTTVNLMLQLINTKDKLKILELAGAQITGAPCTTAGEFKPVSLWGTQGQWTARASDQQWWQPEEAGFREDLYNRSWSRSVPCTKAGDFEPVVLFSYYQSCRVPCPTARDFEPVIYHDHWSWADRAPCPTAGDIGLVLLSEYYRPDLLDILTQNGDKLKKLDLSGTMITGAGLAGLHAPQLELLNFHSCFKLTDCGLVELLANIGDKLKKLDLS